METQVPVRFGQNGTWGGRTFTGRLVRRPSPFPNLFSDEDTAPLEAVLVIDDTPDMGPWRGRTYRAGETMPGRFAEGYANPFAGQLYIGYMRIEGTNFPPSEVFDAPVGYIQIDEGHALSQDQRKLLREACFLARPFKFSPGATIYRLFAEDALHVTKPVI